MKLTLPSYLVNDKEIDCSRLDSIQCCNFWKVSLLSNVLDGCILFLASNFLNFCVTRDVRRERRPEDRTEESLRFCYSTVFNLASFISERPGELRT